ncbi:MAG TPA: protease inhibitor I42 family protein [bacterium]|nr:protease inhibitor I42 family protein [bacterium]HPN45731.1 protease inhibitor I42 family protein [bacterium]
MLRLLLVITILPAFFIACKQNLNNSLVVTEEKNGSSVQLHKGDTFTVNLRGNPTTGYLWEAQMADSTVIRQNGDYEYHADHTEPGYVGSPGMFTFRFTAVGKGQNDLQFIYHRPFEPDNPPEKTFRVTVIVK